MSQIILALSLSSQLICCADPQTNQSQIFKQFKQAINAHDIQQVCILIKRNNVNAQDSPGPYGQTPLMVAAAKSFTDIMRVLIDAGAEVNAVYGLDQPHAGKPVLRYAIDSGSLPAVQMLLNAGADANRVTECPIIHPKREKAHERNLTLLACAIHSHASIDIIKALIKAGASINKGALLGHWTPLMIAAYDGYTQAVEELLVAGADKTLKNSNDGSLTALDYADEMGYQEIVELLLN